MQDFKFLQSNFSIENSQTSNTRTERIPEIYLVEDDIVFGKTVKAFLENKFSIKVNFFPNPSKCLEALEGRSRPLYCLLTDISFDECEADGLLLIDVLKERKHFFESIVITGFASVETAITATKKGVYQYLTKPFDLEVLEKLVRDLYVNRFGIQQVLIDKKSNNTNISLSHIIDSKLELPSNDDFFQGMIGRSDAMKKVFERIKKVAATDSTVLITGPSGTGKELVAKAIHNLSTRSQRIVSVNCGAIPSELLESELFGHVKGAFTGAISTRKGRFELAHRGTIFLDEIGDMPLLLQVKLLRVLQNREIEPVGSTSTINVDTRIITATHQNLEQLVKDGRFREDLYYRLNVIPIQIPSLNERKEDIPLLISYFLSKFVSADGSNKIEFRQDVLDVLMDYKWPGNVRELENLIERLVILKGGSVLTVQDLPSKFFSKALLTEANIDQSSHIKTFKSSIGESFISSNRSNSILGSDTDNNSREVGGRDYLIKLPDSGIDLKETLIRIEESLIQQALVKTLGNKNQASKLLRMNRTTLIEKMKVRGTSWENISSDSLQ